MTTRAGTLAIFLVATFAASVAAALELGGAAWIPDEAGIYVEFQSLGEEKHAFMAGETFRRLATYPPMLAWLKAEGPKLVEAARGVHRALDATPPEILDGIFGGRVGLAVLPPTGDRENSAAALVIDAPNQGVLERVFERLIASQRASNTWVESRQASFGDRSIEVHVARPDRSGPRLYQAVVDSRAVLTNDWPLFERVLALGAGEGGAALSENATFQAGFASLDSSAAARMYIEPRAWVAILGEHATAPLDQGPKLARQIVMATWRAMDYFVLSFDLVPRVSFECFTHWRGDELPQELRRGVAAISGETDFALRAPRGAILAVGGRWRLGELARPLVMAQARISVDDGSGDERLFRHEDLYALAALAVADQIGPELGAHVVAMPDLAQANRSWPLDVVLEMSTRPFAGDAEQRPLSETIAPLVRAGMAIVAATYNARHAVEQARVETESLDGVEISSLVGVARDLPLAEAASAVAGDRVWLGTSRDGVRRSATREEDDSLESTLAERDLASPRLDRPSQLAFIDLAAWRELAWEHRETLAALAKAQEVDDETARRNWRALLALLRLSDGMALFTRFDESGAGLSLRFDAYPTASVAR